MDSSNRISYRQLGNSRKGSKYRDTKYLYAGSAGFAGGHQLGQGGNFNYAIFILMLCEWNTAWTLLFKPLENGEKEEIKKELQSFNAGWIENINKTPEIYEIEQLRDTIKLTNASSDFNLDEKLTKSTSMAQLKQLMKKAVNPDFKNLTKDVLDQ